MRSQYVAAMTHQEVFFQLSNILSSTSSSEAGIGAEEEPECAASRETRQFGITSDFISRTFRKSTAIQIYCMMIFNKARNCVWKQHTWNKKPLHPSLKLAATLCHLDSGANYSDMQYSWRVAKKTLSIVVREVCNDICKEYVHEVMIAPLHLKNGNNWLMVSSRCWTLINCDATIDDKRIAFMKRVIYGFL